MIDTRPFELRPSIKYFELPYLVLEKIAVIYLIIYINSVWKLEYFTEATK